MIADFRKNKKDAVKNQVFMHIAGVLLMCLLVVLVIANVRIQKKRQEFLAQVANLQRQVEQLQESNSDLKEGISKENDPAYIEKIAREQLDLQKEGETTVSFIMPSPNPQQDNTQSGDEVQSWFSKIWQGIKSIF